MEEMPSQNIPVQRLKVTLLPLELTCSGLVTYSGEFLTTGKSHKKKPDGHGNETTIEETSGCPRPRPELANKWPHCTTDNDDNLKNSIHFCMGRVYLLETIYLGL
jgi:hypothetical protein